MTPLRKWTLVNGVWVQRWFILETNPFRETPTSPPLKSKEQAA